MSQSMAGGSAAAKAHELREQGARLEEEARQWDKGAEGERRTAAVLSGLAARGYVVLDDLAIPGSNANIDHVVIGPTGVVVVETKAYTGRLNVNGGVLWHGKYPLCRELGAAQFEADKVRDVVASTGWTVMVRNLMCIHGVDVPADPAGSLAPIELCGPLNLLARIEAAQELLSPAHVSHLVSVVEQALPPQRIVASAHLASPTQPSKPLVVGPPLRRPGQVFRRRRRGVDVVSVVDAGLRKLGLMTLRLVVLILGALLMMAIASTAFESIGNHIATTTTTTTTTSVPAPPAVP